MTWEQGDIADPEAIDRVVSAHGIGAIVHLAALQVPLCRADPIAGARANVVGTVSVFETARRHGLRRVTYASSVAAHGASPDTPYLATLYGAYKACDEAVARVYAKDWQVPSVGIRPGVVYGVGRDQGMTSKTTVAILAAVLGKEYEVPFRGAVSYLYAGEIASAFVRAVSRDGEGAPVFDCNGVIATVEEGLDTLRDLVPSARIRAGGDPLPFPRRGLRRPPARAHRRLRRDFPRRGHRRDPARLRGPVAGRKVVGRSLKSCAQAGFPIAAGTPDGRPSPVSVSRGTGYVTTPFPHPALRLPSRELRPSS